MKRGLIFGSTANGNPSIFMPIPNRYYERVSGWSASVLNNIADGFKFEPITEKVRQVDWHGGYTAGAGHALYTARTYPKEWWNRVAFVCGPTGHLVGTFILTRDGAGYRSKSPFNLVASDDEWSAPIMAEVGPDGNVWVLDWYNFIVQHNPTPQGFETGRGNAYETKLRDKKYGRVYRVVYEGNQGLDSASQMRERKMIVSGLNAEDELGLVNALTHSNMFWRRTAQRLLMEKGALSEPAIARLKALVQDQNVDDAGLNPGAIHAIASLSAIGKWSGREVGQAMKHPSAGVRRAAISFAVPDEKTVDAISAAAVLEDADSQVRLAALLKLSDSQTGIASIAGLLSRPDQVAMPTQDGNLDRWLLDAWTAAASTHSEALLSQLMRSDARVLAPQVLDRIEIVAQHAARNKLDPDAIGQLAAAKGNPQVTAAVIAGLVKGWPRNYSVKLSESASRNIVDQWLAGELPLEVKSQVIQLAGSLGIASLDQAIASIRKELMDQLTDATQDTLKRVSAAKQMVSLEPEQVVVVDALLEQATPQSAPELSLGMVAALSGSKIPDLVVRLIEKSRGMPPEFLKSSVRIMLSRPETTRALIDAIADGQLSVNELQLDQRQLLRDHPDPAIREKATAMLKSSGGIPNPDRQKLVESWMSLASEAGDAEPGKAMYVKHCALCHRHGDLGNNIGPDLTGMAVHPKSELLVHILDPNRSVEGNFRTYNVQTVDGNVVTGMLSGESKTAIEIINVQGKREVVLREDIEQLNSSQKSLMPEGFEGQMTQAEFRDLLEFLTSKGKYVPLSIASVATVVTTRGMFFEPDGQVERLVFPDWQPKMFRDVPFVLIDPQVDRVPNAIMLNGPNGKMAPKMPKSVEVVCNAPAVAIHFLSGVGGWSFPASRAGTTSMVVELTYDDGAKEEHPLINGEHFADYVRRVDVPESEFAFDLAGRQIRYLSVRPRDRKPLKSIRLVKGDDPTAPVVMAMTLQTQE